MLGAKKLVGLMAFVGAVVNYLFLKAEDKSYVGQNWEIGLRYYIKSDWTLYSFTTHKK